MADSRLVPSGFPWAQIHQSTRPLSTGGRHTIGPNIISSPHHHLHHNNRLAGITIQVLINLLLKGDGWKGIHRPIREGIRIQNILGGQKQQDTSLYYFVDHYFTLHVNTNRGGTEKTATLSSHNLSKLKIPPILPWEQSCPVQWRSQTQVAVSKSYVPCSEQPGKHW